MGLKSYDAKQVTVIVGGAILSGFADGSFVKVERNVDAFSLIVGADGEATRSKSNNRSGRVTVTLQQTSDSNTILAAYAAADELTNSGIVPVLIKDNSGVSIHSAAQAWIVKYAGSDYAKESGTKEWVMESSDLITFPGGN